MRTLMQIAEDARRSKYAVAKLGTNDKNRGILAIADTLMAHADEIIAANSFAHSVGSRSLVTPANRVASSTARFGMPGVFNPSVSLAM